MTTTAATAQPATCQRPGCLNAEHHDLSAGDFPASPAHHLYDAHTAEDLGPATPEQVAASDEAYAKDGSGGFLIDADGDVVADGSWGAQQPGVRSVYTEVA